MRRLTPYLLLTFLVLGTGLGIGLGLSEAPMVLGGPLPSNPTRVMASWQAGYPMDQPAFVAPAKTAQALAAAIDQAPMVEGVYHCPPASTAPDSVTLAFSYSLSPPGPLHASFTVTVQISFTGCRWMWIVGSSSSTRWWLTSEIIRDLQRDLHVPGTFLARDP